MNDQTTHELLTEIRDLQREALKIARDNHAMASRQFERAEALRSRKAKQAE